MPILTDILTALKTAINGMTTPTYNFNYANCDERRPANKTYPNVLLEYPEELSISEDEAPTDMYYAERDINFIVTVDNFSGDPVDTDLDKVLEDIKRLLEAEHNELNCQGLVVGDFQESSREYTHVRKRPGIITIVWNFKYRVRRSDPAIT